ncbi:hypothetical protein K3758_16740 (plasmid) [Sulfitobacter sp. W002]|uniref:hypothetical protein n=1 Tax=Sulfitobacter sp. W002 TaxID=2867024 RepID=UPI0021A647FC|nr:hypothetical protein [Sulfitobacter sp. W002]UWR31758.1 hypothetical protein K3758_16740 [Sulfitobacter sp. W002]
MLNAAGDPIGADAAIGIGGQDLAQMGHLFHGHGAAEYHYHAGSTFPNLPACLAGVVAQDNFATNAANGIGSANAGGGPGGPGGGPDFDAIAETSTWMPKP